MRRRDFIKVIAGSVAAWPLAAQAQPLDQMRRIGVLMPYAEDDPETSPRVCRAARRISEARLDGRPEHPVRASLLVCVGCCGDPQARKRDRGLRTRRDPDRYHASDRGGAP